MLQWPPSNSTITIQTKILRWQQMCPLKSTRNKRTPHSLPAPHKNTMEKTIHEHIQNQTTSDSCEHVWFICGSHHKIYHRIDEHRNSRSNQIQHQIHQYHYSTPTNRMETTVHRENFKKMLASTTPIFRRQQRKHVRHNTLDRLTYQNMLTTLHQTMGIIEQRSAATLVKTRICKRLHWISMETTQHAYISTDATRKNRPNPQEQNTYQTSKSSTH